MKTEAIVTAVELDKSNGRRDETVVTIEGTMFKDVTITLKDSNWHPEFKFGDVVTVEITPVKQENTDNA